ncbi:putative porphobilinogen deaminase [Actinoplanes missouriensis 431]|uniref:Porphobilinogen deaminase n=1 Tax=Actinoplanes missouriensis (strain ATCC 14538 / DSM 43046 / CBS 188.64 / JCM 3121 / NBRC 102363 / NCIMB 12654 / NRRL B-3342 / UNCC 431) TaxID=512565 RepID=I0GYE1_ACTM4|nr:hydroxymethylbilane synthase [Actinoplanes missouriensis]BAL85778.1 putative porphobilinogen deaminase [Actinoplanes missouriensis 431]
MSASRLLRIGTRSSPMALAQVERVRLMLAERHPDVTVEVLPLSTSGDRWQGSLADLGGKGAFTKEVDQALLDGRVDLAVHCVKDVPGDRPAPAGTVLAAYLARDDVRDCLIHPGGRRIDQLPAGSRVGTSAVRRIAQLALHYPHLTAVPIRGNANSRLAKLDAGDYDALLLAVSGLHRIGQEQRMTHPIDVDTFVPAVGSGTLVLQCRDDDTVAVELAESLGDRRTRQETEAERWMLHILQGSCHSPIAGYARTEPDGRIGLRARVISIDGKTVLDVHEWATDPIVLGTSVAAALLRQGARDILDEATR